MEVVKVDRQEEIMTIPLPEPTMLALKINHWNIEFLWGFPIFRCYAVFSGSKC